MIAKDIYEMELSAPELAAVCKPGQFFNLYTGDGAMMLPRPISLCSADRENGVITLVYRAAGQGTALFSRLVPGNSLRVLGPLGNGFPLGKPGKAAIVGGGVGIPPLLELCKALAERGSGVTAFLGYRDETFLLGRFQKLGVETVTASETGGLDYKGNIIDLLKTRSDIKPDVFYACGPKPMFNALAEYVYRMDDPPALYVSLEERMACGFGACRGCAVKTVDGYKRVCKDGPVFEFRELEK
jgi:dihydroorotate dehydrogenase electron transfer subunit